MVYPKAPVTETEWGYDLHPPRAQDAQLVFPHRIDPGKESHWPVERYWKMTELWTMPHVDVLRKANLLH